MIYDCFLYNGEKELLEIRLNETKLFNQEVMTVGLLSDMTHTGCSKPTFASHFKEVSIEFDVFAHIADAKGNTPREREAYQRNQISTAVRLLRPEEDDIVIISDVDEVPRARTVNLFKKDIGFAALIMDKYAYYLNCIESLQSWDRARIMTWKYLIDKLPEEVRNSGYDFSIHHAGWHWSWVVDPVRKLKSFSHQELNNDLNIARVKKKENVWNEDELKFTEIGLSHPEYLYYNKEKFNHLIK